MRGALTNEEFAEIIRTADDETIQEIFELLVAELNQIRHEEQASLQS